MKMLKAVLFIFLTALIMSGCRKELSLENQAGTGPVLGSNCLLKKIVPSDSSTGIGFASLTAFFDASDRVNRVELYDSLAGSQEYNLPFTFVGDTIFITQSEYFVKDAASGRFASYHTLLDTTDPSAGELKIAYIYDASAQLVQRQYFVVQPPYEIEILRSEYTWQGGNMVHSLLSLKDPTGGPDEKVIECDLSYYSNQNVKEFIYIFPDDIVTPGYLPALELGAKPKNAVSKIVTTTYTNGVADQTYTTNFSNYVLSNEGYVLELYADGDYQDGLAVVDGRTKFEYYCK